MPARAWESCKELRFSWLSLPKEGAIFCAFMMKVCSLFTLECESQALLCSPLIQSNDYDLLHSAYSSPSSGSLERI